MNQSQSNETDAIRSDIDVTRRRMDDTMDALGERLEPQHLLDEFLGFFRRSTEGDGKLAHLREKFTHSADTAMHAVIDTVKKNPLPALVIGAGIAWMIYEGRRARVPDYRDDADDPNRDDSSYDSDQHYDRPLEYPPSDVQSEWSDQGGSTLGQMGDSLAENTPQAADQKKSTFAHASEVAREKAHHLKERAGETLHAARERVGDLGHRVGQCTRDTVDHHPLESGLACLALGAIAGLLLPTPNAVNRRIGPTADRLRERTREASKEMLEKGKHVAQAAVSAIKEEAQAQGLTPEHLREQTARKEGIAPEGKQSGPQASDPPVARPA